MLKVIEELLKKLNYETVNKQSENHESLLFENALLSRYYGCTQAKVKFNEDLLFDVAEEVLHHYNKMGVEKNRYVSLFLEVQDITHANFQQIVLDTAVDPYTASKSVLLYNPRQEELLLEFVEKNTDIKQAILDVLNNADILCDLRYKIWNDQVYLYDILSKMQASLDLFNLFQKEQTTFLNKYSLNDKEYLIKDEVLLITGKKTPLFEVLEGNTDNFDFFYQNNEVSFSFKTGDKAEVIKYPQGRYLERMDSIQHWFNNDVPLSDEEMVKIEKLFYLLTLKTIGIGFFPHELESGKIVGRSIVDVDYSELLNKNRLEFFELIYNIAVSIEILQSEIIYLNLKNFPETDYAVNFIDWFVELPYLLILNHAERSDNQLYLRYKFKKAGREVKLIN